MRTANIPSATVLVPASSWGSALIEVAAATITKGLPTGWSLDTFESPDGDASLLIMSPDDAATTFLVTGAGGGYQLEALEDDELWLVGTCNSVGHLAWLVDIQIRLEKFGSRRAA